MIHQSVPYIGTYNEYLAAGGKATQQAYDANVQKIYGRAAPTVQGQGFLTQNTVYNAPVQNQAPAQTPEPYYSISPQPTAPASIADAGLAMAAKLYQESLNNQPQGVGTGVAGATGIIGAGIGAGARLFQERQIQQSRQNRASMYGPSTIFSNAAQVASPLTSAYMALNR